MKSNESLQPYPLYSNIVQAWVKKVLQARFYWCGVDSSGNSGQLGIIIDDVVITNKKPVRVSLLARAQK